jgi:hypothetical protein
MFIEAHHGTGLMSPCGEPVDQNGAPSSSQHIEESETRPRERNNFNIAPVFEFGRKRGSRVESDTIVGSDLVSKTDDDER